MLDLRLIATGCEDDRGDHQSHQVCQGVQHGTQEQESSRPQDKQSSQEDQSVGQDATGQTVHYCTVLYGTVLYSVTQTNNLQYFCEKTLS